MPWPSPGRRWSQEASLVLKVFEGDMMKDLLKQIRASFREVKLHAPKASRSSSSEIYIIARDFKGEPIATAGSCPSEIRPKLIRQFI